MGINGFSNFLKKQCQGKVVKNVPIEKFKGKSLAVDIAVTLSVVAYVAKKETTKLKSFPGPEDYQKYCQKIKPILWRELIRFVQDKDVRYVFIFDGPSPELKNQNARLERKAAVSNNEAKFKELYEMYQKKINAGISVDQGLKTKLANSWIQSTPIDSSMYSLAKDILDALGLPWLQSQTEAEKEAAWMARQGWVDGVYTTDSDTLAFGSPFIVRKRMLEIDDFGLSKECFEVIYLQDVLDIINFTYEEYVDLCIAMRCDYNILDVKEHYKRKKKRYGPAKAWQLIEKYRSFEEIPDDQLDKGPFHYETCRKIFKSKGTILKFNPKKINVRYRHFFDQGHDFLVSLGLKTNTIATLYSEQMIDQPSDESSDGWSENESESGSLLEKGQVLDFDTSEEEEEEEVIILPKKARPKKKKKAVKSF